MAAANMLTIAVFAMFLWLAQSRIYFGTPPPAETILRHCNLPPRQEVSDCTNFCRNSTFGQYSCCDEDASPNSRPGSCPDEPMIFEEADWVCTFGYKGLCSNDSACKNNQKCCYTPDTQYRVCREPDL